MDHVRHTSGNGYFFGRYRVESGIPQSVVEGSADGCADHTARTPPGVRRARQAARPVGE